jgi:Putative zinc-binding metallo-peptidase
MNRNMGLPDLYPFVLSTPAVAKLTFIHARIHDQAGRQVQSNRGIRGGAARAAHRRKRRSSPQFIDELFSIKILHSQV